MLKNKAEGKIQSNWRYLLNTRKYFVLFLAVLGLSLATALFAVWPQWQGSYQNYQKIQVSKKRLATLRQKTAQLDEAKASEIISKITQIDLLLPSQKPLQQLLSALQIMQERHKVVLSDVSLAPGEIGQASGGTQSKNLGYEQIDLKLKATGSLAQVNSFLQAVENFSPLTTINKIELNEKRKTTADQTLISFEADLSLSTFYFQKNIVSKVDSKLPVDSSNKYKEVLAKLDSFFYPNYQEPQFTLGGKEDLFQVPAQ